jgi:hypothetical protein
MSLTVWTEHLSRLNASLQSLKDRVREAIVGEFSRILSQSLRDLIQTLLHRSPTVPRDDDPWDEDIDSELSAVPAPQLPRPSLDWLATAGRLILGSQTSSRRPWWPAMAIVGVGIAALTQRPLVLAAAATLQTALELFGP